MGGNSGDSLVEVLHLHRVERNIDYIAIGIHTRHLDPITHSKHGIGGELDRGNEAEDRIFENQEQDGSYRAKTTQK